jgi:hypothetical protein
MRGLQNIRQLVRHMKCTSCSDAPQPLKLSPPNGNEQKPSYAAMCVHALHAGAGTAAGGPRQRAKWWYMLFFQYKVRLHPPFFVIVNYIISIRHLLLPNSL